jgi:peptidoglycan/LPS O-acetylase OafA/YrhL
MPIQKTESGKLGIIELIRGVAAISVCLYHFKETNIDYNGSTKILKLLFAQGGLGIIAFFVVSGFIIPYSLIKANYTIILFFKFLARRCTRIEPPYLVTMFLGILVLYFSTRSAMFKGKPFDITWQQALLHVGYLPEHFGYSWIVAPFWTLEAEFHFYILIGLILPLMWKNKFSLIGSLLVLLTVPFISQSLTIFRFMPYFCFGITTCGYFFKKISYLEYGFLLMLTWLCCYLLKLPSLEPLIAIITSLLICKVKFSSAITNFFAKISYSVYLLHAVIGLKFLNLMGRYVHKSWHTYTFFVLAFIITIGFSYVFYLVVEKPSINLAKQFIYSNNKNKYLPAKSLKQIHQA